MPKALAALAGQALASIEDTAVIDKILAHLEQTAPGGEVVRLPPGRAATRRAGLTGRVRDP